MPKVKEGPKELNSLLESVYSQCMKNNKNKSMCLRVSWEAAKDAGWHKDKDGKWKKRNSGGIKKSVSAKHEHINGFNVMATM